MAPGIGNLFSKDIKDYVPSALEVPFRVKVVNTGIVHEAAYEGSCRNGKLENMTYEVEMNRLNKNLENIKNKISSLELPRGVEFLEPVTVYSLVKKGDPDIHVPHPLYDALTRDDYQTDLYVVTHEFVGLKIAEIYKKPVVILTGAGWAVCTPAAVRQLGIPSFQVKTWEELMSLVNVFKACKSVQNTKILSVTNFPSRIPWGVLSTITNLDILKERYNIGYRFVDYDELFRKMDLIVNDRAYKDEAVEIAESLMKNAGKSNMSKEDVVHSVEYYQAVRSIMKEYGCNAFTVECFELCSSMEPWKRRFTPCLTHALHKDSGIPSACEGDINVLLAMMLEMYLSGKAVYMGNQDVYPEDDTLKIHHSVASLRMNGFNNAGTPYDIHSFTESGFGVNLRHDFNKELEQEVTVSRFDPTGTEILLTRGKIIGGSGMEGCGCAQNILISIPDGKKFFEETQDFGNHLAVVFGDYVDDIRKMGKIMKFETREVL